MAPPLRAVLFDAAGTLIAPAEPIGESYARIAAAHGVALPAARLDDAFRRIFAQAPPLVFPDAGPDERVALERGWWRAVVRGTFRAADGRARFEDFDAFFDALFAHFARPEAWRACEGARELLAELARRGIARAVVSNFDHRLPALLEGLGLPEFDALVLPADAGVAKPDPGIFRTALARLGVAADQALFVGDHPEEDLAGARAAGMRTVDVRSLASLEALLPLLEPEETR